jgi:histone H1/5
MSGSDADSQSTDGYGSDQDQPGVQHTSFHADDKDNPLKVAIIPEHNQSASISKQGQALARELCSIVDCLRQMSNDQLGELPEQEQSNQIEMYVPQQKNVIKTRNQEELEQFHDAAKTLDASEYMLEESLIGSTVDDSSEESDPWGGSSSDEGSTDASSSESKGEVFPVEKILSHKDGLYFVKWVGHHENSWIEYDDVTDIGLRQEYDKASHCVTAPAEPEDQQEGSEIRQIRDKQIRSGKVFYLVDFADGDQLWIQLCDLTNAKEAVASYEEHNVPNIGDVVDVYWPLSGEQPGQCYRAVITEVGPKGFLCLYSDQEEHWEDLQGGNTSWVRCVQRLNMNDIAKMPISNIPSVEENKALVPYATGSEDRFSDAIEGVLSNTVTKKTFFDVFKGGSIHPRVLRWFMHVYGNEAFFAQLFQLDQDATIEQIVYEGSKLYWKKVHLDRQNADFIADDEEVAAEHKTLKQQRHENSIFGSGDNYDSEESSEDDLLIVTQKDANKQWDKAAKFEKSSNRKEVENKVDRSAFRQQKNEPSDANPEEFETHLEELKSGWRHRREQKKVQSTQELSKELSKVAVDSIVNGTKLSNEKRKEISEMFSEQTPVTEDSNETLLLKCSQSGVILKKRKLARGWVFSLEIPNMKPKRFRSLKELMEIFSGISLNWEASVSAELKAKDAAAQKEAAAQQKAAQKEAAAAQKAAQKEAAAAQKAAQKEAAAAQKAAQKAAAAKERAEKLLANAAEKAGGLIGCANKEFAKAEPNARNTAAEVSSCKPRNTTARTTTTFESDVRGNKQLRSCIAMAKYMTPDNCGELFASFFKNSNGDLKPITDYLAKQPAGAQIGDTRYYKVVKTNGAKGLDSAANVKHPCGAQPAASKRPRGAQPEAPEVPCAHPDQAAVYISDSDDENPHLMVPLEHSDAANAVLQSENTKHNAQSPCPVQPAAPKRPRVEKVVGSAANAKATPVIDLTDFG